MSKPWDPAQPGSGDRPVRGWVQGDPARAPPARSMQPTGKPPKGRRGRRAWSWRTSP